MVQSSLTNPLSVNDEKTWYWRGFPITYNLCGDNGPAVILVHGFGASWQHWRKNLPILGQTCRCYALDLIGFGVRPNLPQKKKLTTPLRHGDNRLLIFARKW